MKTLVSFTENFDGAFVLGIAVHEAQPLLLLPERLSMHLIAVHEAQLSLHLSERLSMHLFDIELSNEDPCLISREL
jgi:hypothetical protein